MTKEIIEKISSPVTSLEVNDISVEEKKNLAEFLLAKGFTSSTFYLRFFQKGFDVWEIEGIDSCKKQFLVIKDATELLKGFTETDALGNEIGKKGYLYDLATGDKTPGVFLTCLKKAGGGLLTRFYAFMKDKGMSLNTTNKRFSADDWKPWEQEGIKTLLLQFENIGKHS